MTPFERLRDVMVVDAILVSAAGKVLGRELAAREREAASARRGTPSGGRRDDPTSPGRVRRHPPGPRAHYRRSA